MVEYCMDIVVDEIQPHSEPSREDEDLDEGEISIFRLLDHEKEKIEEKNEQEYTTQRLNKSFEVR